MFLNSVAARGPSVPPARLRAFRWLREHLGVPFPVNSRLVRGFLQVPQEHQPQQAKALTPGDFWNLVAASIEAGETMNFEVNLVIFAALACIRCAHLARSRLTTETDDQLYLHCTMGKRRKMGSRPSYDWATPKPHFLGSFHSSSLSRSTSSWVAQISSCQL